MNDDPTNTSLEEQKKTKLDYTLSTPEERTAFVDSLLKQGGPTSPKWLEIYSNYILEAQSKEEKQKKEILTDNRLITINKNETSYEGLALKFENGEDGLSSILRPSDKNVLLSPKSPITEKDIEEIPGLKELRDNIEILTAQFKKSQGRKKYLLKKQIIELYQDQYVLKEAYRKPIRANKLIPSYHTLEIDEDVTIIDNTDVTSKSLISFFNKDHVAALLRTLSILRIQTKGQFNSDLHYLVEEFDNLITRTLKEDYPELFMIVSLKVDGESAQNIQSALETQLNISYTLEYISSLWRNKIPKLIVEKAKDEYLEWYYTFKEYGKWKKCSCCEEVKLASPRFFSKNKSSRDGFYSVCKKCRSKKYAKKTSGQK